MSIQNGKESSECIATTKIPVPTFTYTLDGNPVQPMLFDLDGDGVQEKWYPYGTQVTVNFAEDMTNLNGDYTKKSGWSDDTRYSWDDWSSTRTTQYIYATYKYVHVVKARIRTTKGIIDYWNEVEEQVNIMPDGTSALHDRNCVVGKIYPVEVTGKTDTRAVYGTDIYRRDTRIYRAAMHYGLISAGDTDIVYIKVVDAETSTGSTWNGITSQDNDDETTLCYVFVDEDGNEI